MYAELAPEQIEFVTEATRDFVSATYSGQVPVGQVAKHASPSK
jgi:hypothetical protein